MMNVFNNYRNLVAIIVLFLCWCKVYDVNGIQLAFSSPPEEPKILNIPIEAKTKGNTHLVSAHTDPVNNQTAGTRKNSDTVKDMDKGLLQTTYRNLYLNKHFFNNQTKERPFISGIKPSDKHNFNTVYKIKRIPGAHVPRRNEESSFTNEKLLYNNQVSFITNDKKNTKRKKTGYGNKKNARRAKKMGKNVRNNETNEMFNKKYLQIARQKNTIKIISHDNSFPAVSTKRYNKHGRQGIEEDTITPETTTKKSVETVDEYLSPYAIVPQMGRILQNHPNANVSYEVLGRTAEYNDIVLFKITQNPNETEPTYRAGTEGKYVDEAPEKKIIFIVHGLTVMGLNTLSCLTEEDKVKILINYYLDFLDKFDIFIIPIANPDGYVASKSRTGTFWNKNKSPQKDCRGVMLDRNFDVAFNSSQTISSCSQGYPGPTPFSEPETRAIRDVLHYHGHKIIAYIHVHAGSYDTNAFKGDAVLYPRGFTDVQTDDDKYIDLRGEIDEAMKNASFQVVSVAVDTLHNWYGKVTGTSVDYAAVVYGIPFAMEFVMQLYASSMFASADEDLVDYTALTQIWKRVINVVFNYIARGQQTTTNEKKKKK